MMWLTLACAQQDGRNPGWDFICNCAAVWTKDVVVDQFEVVPAPADVLLVAATDPASTALLAEQLPRLLDLVAEDARIVVVSGDPAEAPLGVWTAADGDPGAFLEALDLGEPGAVVEIRGAISAALSDPATPLRADRDLHVVVAGAGLDDTDPAGDLAFSEWFAALRPPPLAARVHCATTAEVPSECGALAAETGGVEIPWVEGEDLDDIAIELGDLRRGYPLSRLPIAPTLSLEVEQEQGALFGFDLEEDFVWDEVSNTVRLLEYVPHVGSRVHVRYEERE
jgi:hypothetical protein